MPLITVTLRSPKTTEFKNAVFDAVHGALVESGVPVEDLFQRAIELDAVNFRFDARYPDARQDRDENFVLIEILWSAGRSVKIKKKLLDSLMQRLSAQEIHPENVMVVFKETTWENWSFAGGRLIHT
ncbi:tautomerase family protein [Undibacterium sp. RuRC25W]|uniref:tautomerase family protein n=1 Tax=Undibacterium sp. RuRC25W TaxID=3413047 RepID=UPI003BF2ED54